MNDAPCPVCACARVEGVSTHAIVVALVADDVDGAIELGLLTDSGCAGCSDVCTQMLTVARDGRQRALAARERFRARETRLQRRADERANKRAAPPAPVVASETAVSTAAKPALPSAAAAALARAKAKAAERGPR